MPVMEKLKMFIVQEPVVAASCLIAGLFLPAVVRPMLDSFESSKQVPQPALSDVSIELGFMISMFPCAQKIMDASVFCYMNLAKFLNLLLFII
ncbi:hypothetical protein Patl1_00626 [Pistacia atlantica]|uniref:Uncharacterized protein n=1 Tax=Pistacia atlantica TaxID=434234 RepID=A0ACC1C5V8_9ROSI|nr:hypothetical protein Patl1_00626 [Pistacia atlantica]